MMVLAELEGHYKPGSPPPGKLENRDRSGYLLCAGKRSRGASPMNIENSRYGLEGQNPKADSSDWRS
jgi:hypothetical protein